ncbi:MAG: stealth conserved region 3 domain-containing protein [Acidobacteria bacterium]|nr:stealth conserved region 3 domain-containing protein [Acidobacteriota bacterium]
MATEPIDAVYTWVDGSWPGYDDLLRQYAQDRHDLNPNRYRDNLSILKYSLRSLARYAPWVRRVFVVSCRPQCPPWLDTAKVRLVHHDEFMAAGDLPTFNSFAIVSNLHRIDGLSSRFLYIEDDKLFGSPAAPDDVFDADGRPRIYLKSRAAIRPAQRESTRLSPWNRALAQSNYLLDARYGAKRRAFVHHAPLAVALESWRAMIDQWPEVFAQTSASRFRATGNVAPEYLYPHYLLEEGRGARVARRETMRRVAYHPLNNLLPLQRAGFFRLRWQRPRFFCMNDNFDQQPHPRAVALAQHALDAWFAEPSPFEVH